MVAARGKKPVARDHCGHVHTRPGADGRPDGALNDLAEFIGDVAAGLYPDSVRDGKYGIYANTEKVEIGVPYPRSVKAAAPERTVERPFDGDSILVLMFSEQDLTALLTKSNIAAAKTIADWLADAWGAPTVLTKQRN